MFLSKYRLWFITYQNFDFYFFAIKLSIFFCSMKTSQIIKNISFFYQNMDFLLFAIKITSLFSLFYKNLTILQIFLSVYRLFRLIFKNADFLCFFFHFSCQNNAYVLLFSIKITVVQETDYFFFQVSSDVIFDVLRAPFKE